MTRDPRRLLDDPSELEPDAIRALEAGLDEGAPPGAKAAVWGALSTVLPNAAAAASATAASGAVASATATAGVSVVKLGAIGVALGTVSGAGIFAVERVTAPVRAPAAYVASAVPRTSALPPPAVVNGATASPRVEPEAAPSIAPEPAAPGRRAGTAPESTQSAELLLEESRRVANARTLLRQGAAADALSALVAIERELPNGMLSQEREALTIETLAVLGHRELVQQRAARFLARYPSSPHAEAVRRAAESLLIPIRPSYP